MQMRSCHPSWDVQSNVERVVRGNGLAHGYTPDGFYDRPHWWNSVYGEDDAGINGAQGSDEGDL